MGLGMAAPVRLRGFLPATTVAIVPVACIRPGSHRAPNPQLLDVGTVVAALAAVVLRLAGLRRAS